MKSLMDYKPLTEFSEHSSKLFVCGSLEDVLYGSIYDSGNCFLLFNSICILEYDWKNKC